jgi:NAD(P)-dependent dehydrogenase (short-subunit alcohol dehydrogenase family)
VGGDATGLAGRHALVTGAGRGIGAAVAARLSALGASVTLVARTRAALEAAAARCDGPTCVQCADVTDAGAVRAAFAAATRALGPVEILVNNAGAAESAPFARIDRAQWERMLAVNLTGVLNCIQAALPAMTNRGWGRIVNIASTAGLKGYAYAAAYCAAKHGVVGLTRALALETAKRGITVNAVCPGYTDTDLVAEAVASIRRQTGRSESEALAELTRGSPQGRLIRPEEVAHAVAWLCLPGSESITGQCIAVAGGEVM